MNADDKYPYALPQGTILSGQYIIDRVLGQGGFGITYQATDHKSGEKVAIKEYFPDAFAGRTDNTKVTPFTGERGDSFKYGKDCFLQEAETLAKFIGNENIVRVHTYFEENGTAYFVMDFVEGTSFDRYIRDHGGRISYEDAERILVPVMDALAAVNSKGIVHRDVTPDNIYITADGVVKLLDFGAARYSLGDRSRSLDVVLKHGFAPREQYTRHGRQGAFTDVYSLGATFYYAITGKRPPDSIDRIDEDIMPTPSSLGAKLPPQKEDAILTALSVNAADRYQTMPEFKQALFAVAKSGTRDLGNEQIPVSGTPTNQNLRSQIPASGIPMSGFPTTGIPNSSSEDTISLMERRMMLLLESEEWNKASGYAERILEVQPENARAYVAKFMLANGYSIKEQIKNHRQPLENETFFNIAYRYADKDLKEELDLYRNAVAQRLQNVRYNQAMLLMNSGDTQKITQARAIFSSMGEWNDAHTQAIKCDNLLKKKKSSRNILLFGVCGTVIGVILLVTIVFQGFILLLGAGRSISKEQQSKEITYEVDHSDEPLELNEYPEINLLAEKMITSDSVDDLLNEGVIRKAPSSPESWEWKAFLNSRNYIAKYENLNCYTVSGPYEGYYFVIFTYEIVYKDWEDISLPTYTGFYACPDQDGVMYISTGWDEAMGTYCDKIWAQYEADKIGDDIDSDYNDILESNPDFSKFIDSLNAEFDEYLNSSE